MAEIIKRQVSVDRMQNILQKYKWNIALEKSFLFSCRIINLYNFLTEEYSEFIISKQLLRSGTSICANLKETIKAISRKEFLSKIYIALKEAEESSYWLDLLYVSKYLTEEQYNSITQDCTEIIKIISKATYTARQNLKKQK